MNIKFTNDLDVKIYLDFSLDFDGQLENIDRVEKNGVDVTDKVSYSDLTPFVEKMKELDGFIVSEHRTQVQVFVFEEDMDIVFRSFNEPEDGEFDDHTLEQVPLIEELKV